jgi:pyruvate/2-oxoglutarate dehydrogenase complex dihydrolipoamide dehydrogenase (E3) component
MDYNVVVIGAGSAGLVSAYICAILKAKVLLIERHKMGGDCLNTGCVPSKALIRTTTFLSYIRRHKEFGLDEARAEFRFSEVMERVQRVIRKVAPHDSVERYTSLGVECARGEARILSPHAVKVDSRTVTAKNIILASGATPAVPSIPGLDKIRYYHTDNIWDIREQPRRLAVIGGGPIGCELGQCFARLGTKVIQVQTASQLLNREDDEVVRIMEKRFREEGVELHLQTKPLEIQVRDGRKLLVAEEAGKRVEIEFDEILIAVGRKPRIQGFGLETLGVKLNERGGLWTDAYSRTSVKNIFACGDVTSPYQFTHMAAHQAWYCAVNALFQPLVKFKVDLSMVPWCTYTDPEIARVGLNEKEAKAKNVPYEVATYGLEDLDRAIADEEDVGMVKVLTEPGKDRILGVTICGYHAGDLLAEFVLAKRYRLGLNRIMGAIHVYPTMAEANKFAAGAWKKAHAPEKILSLLGKLHAFRRGRAR